MSSQSEGKTLFTSYTVYKGKAALSIKPIAPTFQAVGNNQKLAREGSLLLEFAPAGGNGMATNQREYDWSKKQFFALNLAEMGDLISFDKTKGFELFHDPNLGGLYFNLFISDKNSGGSGSISAPVTLGEYEVIKTMTQFLIPKFLGLDQI
eukprot:gene7351-7932_t